MTKFDWIINIALAPLWLIALALWTELITLMLLLSVANDLIRQVPLRPVRVLWREYTEAVVSPFPLLRGDWRS